MNMSVKDKMVDGGDNEMDKVIDCFGELPNFRTEF